ncbi:MAG: TetR/AcrR family transcriptional regulator [Corynebacteriales bacterium]|nr:TetR/AcrR family transcriptional regulator [Mycobacteriales bacterium]
MNAARRIGRPPKEEAGPTRQRLLDVALDLFSEHGFAGTSVRMIARAAEVSDSGLYAHFPSKQAIFDELKGGESPYAAVNLLSKFPVAEHQHDPVSFLRSLTATLLKAWDSRRGRKFTKLLLREDLSDGGDDYKAMLDELCDHLAPYFAQWRKEGTLRETELNAQELAWEYIAAVGYTRLVYLQGGPATREFGHKAANRHVEFFLDAIRR